MGERKKHMTPENKAIIDKMKNEDKPIKEMIEAIKTTNPDSTVKYENVYNYIKRCERNAKKLTAADESVESIESGTTPNNEQITDQTSGDSQQE